MYILFFTAKTDIPIWNAFLSKSNQILQYGNILKHNTQYSIDPYCFIPILYYVYLKNDNRKQAMVPKQLQKQTDIVPLVTIINVTKVLWYMKNEH